MRGDGHWTTEAASSYLQQLCENGCEKGGGSTSTKQGSDFVQARGGALAHASIVVAGKEEQDGVHKVLVQWASVGHGTSDGR